VKGYQYAKGQYVVVTDDDFEKARVAATQTFDIRAFVPANEVEDLYFEEPYHLEPKAGLGSKHTRFSAMRCRIPVGSELEPSCCVSAST
jgi:DNA end-binding protein Ku